MIECLLGIGYLRRIVPYGNNQQVPLGEWCLFYFGVVLPDDIGSNIEFQPDAVENVVFFDTIKVILFSFYGLAENVVWGGLFLFLLVDVCPKAILEKISETPMLLLFVCKDVSSVYFVWIS